MILVFGGPQAVNDIYTNNLSKVDRLAWIIQLIRDLLKIDPSSKLSKTLYGYPGTVK